MASVRTGSPAKVAKANISQVGLCLSFGLPFGRASVYIGFEATCAEKDENGKPTKVSCCLLPKRIRNAKLMRSKHKPATSGIQKI